MSVASTEAGLSAAAIATRCQSPRARVPGYNPGPETGPGSDPLQREAGLQLPARTSVDRRGLDRVDTAPLPCLARYEDASRHGLLWDAAYLGPLSLPA